ncbi:MAG: JAB domain-containing protein [Rhodocyclaceae bacterium]|nr:MAG: JAB domain-containing protein [Rhodocyclaceae bacterium]
MAITDWPAAERPRERLLAQGAQALSDAELLAIFLRVGIPGKSAVDLARDLLAGCKGQLAQLAATPPKELAKLPGLGPAKACQLAAAVELARRALKEDMHQRDLLGSPGAVRDWLRLHLGKLPHEVFGALWLDSQNRLIDYDELFRGTLNQASVYPREVVKQALARNAAAVVLVHNHPSGVAEASRADELLTRTLKEALALVDVKLADHFVVAGNANPLSFAEKGLI